MSPAENKPLFDLDPVERFSGMLVELHHSMARWQALSRRVGD